MIIPDNWKETRFSPNQKLPVSYMVLQDEDGYYHAMKIDLTWESVSTIDKYQARRWCIFMAKNSAAMKLGDAQRESISKFNHLKEKALSLFCCKLHMAHGVDYNFFLTNETTFQKSFSRLEEVEDYLLESLESMPQKGQK